MLDREPPRGLAHRRQLVAQQVAVLEAQPDAALAEERVGLDRHRQVRQRLVPADVEGAQGDAPAAHRLRDRVVDRAAAPRRRARPLRSRKRNSVRTRPAPSAPRDERRARVGDRPQVGGHVERRAVAGDGRLLGEGELPGVPLGSLAGAPPILLHQLRPTASTCSSPVLPSSDDGGALGQVQHVAARPPRPPGCPGPGPGSRRARWGCPAPARRRSPGPGPGRPSRRGSGRRRPGLPRRSSAARSGRSALAGPARPPRVRRRRAPAGRGRAGPPTGPRPRRGSPPRRRRRRRPVPMPGLHVGEHLGVGEQRQVRVEDAGLRRRPPLVRSGPWTRSISRRTVATASTMRRHSAAGSTAACSARRVRRRGGQPADRADRDARRRRQRSAAPVGRRRQAGPRRRRRSASSNRRVRQREEVLDRLLGLRPGRADLDLVAAQGGERRDPAQACRPGPGRRRW